MSTVKIELAHKAVIAQHSMDWSRYSEICDTRDGQICDYGLALSGSLPCDHCQRDQLLGDHELNTCPAGWTALYHIKLL